MSPLTRRRRSNCGEHRVLRAAISLLLVVSVPAVGCRRIERGRQIRAQGQLQYLSAIVEAQRSGHQRLPSSEDLKKAVDAQRLRDPWGNTIIYETTAAPTGERYLLASLGADGKLDVPDAMTYFGAPSQDVSYEPTRDIAIVDGAFVRNAGK